LEMLRYLLQCCGADVDWPSAADGRTCLHLAATTGNISIVELLVEHKADVFSKDTAGDTPLHSAASVGNVAVLGLLFTKYGANCIHAVSANGDTLLHKAVKEIQVNMVKSLFDYGANPVAENGDNLTPLECALTDEMRKMFIGKF